MQLEFLPNEILLDLFDYFDGADLLRGFYGLNSRFNLLLYKQFRSYRFRFDFISKRDFDLICQQHLPFIADQVLTLEFSDYRETPGEMNLFFSYISSFQDFTHLQSLTLSHLQSYQRLLTLLDECQHLGNLTHLNFELCSFTNWPFDCQWIVDSIWSLPKLANCYFDIDINYKSAFCVPTIVSSSLRCLSIFDTDFRLNQIHRLFEYTPHLRDLSTYIGKLTNSDYMIYQQPTLIQLTIFFASSFDLRKIAFLQSTSMLRYLDVNTGSELVDGHRWEQIIRNYLPKLKTFRLKMKKSFFSNENLQEKAEKLIDSFRTSFWVYEHQWFVRCFTWDHVIHLYTLSNVSSFHEVMVPESWQSTYPDDDQQEFYNEINDIYDETIFNQPISSNICLPNINCLYMKLPINNQFWSIVPNLNKLNSLTVSSHTDTFQSQLQTLLDRASHLHTLRISQDSSLPLQMSLFQSNNASVRQINLYDYNHSFNEKECLLFSRSPLGVQCQVLSIQVNHRESIIHLIQNMLHLRVLSVKCVGDECHKQSLFSNDNDKLVLWLKDHLPSTYVIVRDSENKTNIVIWL